jgi:hypothetical protein
MEFLIAALVYWLLHVTLAVIAAYPILSWGNDRARWNAVDLLGLVLPFGIWAAAMAVSLEALIGGLLISGLVVLGATVRVLIGRRRRPYVWSSVLLGLMCAAASGIYAFTPHWGESGLTMTSERVQSIA